MKSIFSLEKKEKGNLRVLTGSPVSYTTVLCTLATTSNIRRYSKPPSICLQIQTLNTMKIYVIILVTLSSTLHSTSSANILALLPPPFPSHSFWSRPLLDALQSRGHHLTVFSPFHPVNPGPNRRDIIIEHVFESSDNIFQYPSLIKDNTIQTLLSTLNFLESMHVVDTISMASNATQHLLNSTEHFDLILVDLTFGECFLGFVHKFHYPPVIGVVPYGVDPFVNDLFGNPELPSYIPHAISPVSDRMSFYERLLNGVVHLWTKWFYRAVQVPRMDRLARKYFGEDLPSVAEIGRNMSLVLVNTHDSVDYPRPLVPAMIPVGGMHTRPAKTLPKVTD